MEPLLRIVQLRKSFGEHEVLAGIDLEIMRGETVSVIGPSGSGKTTLLRCINYLEKPSGGEIHIDGKLIGVRPSNGGYVHLSDRELAKERQEIGFVFQRFNLFPHLTALDNVTIAPRKVLGLSRPEAEARGREVLGVMRQLAEEGRTMVIVTHEIQFAGEVSDRIIFMDEGKIVEDGPPGEVLYRSRHPRTKAFLSRIQER